MDGCRHDERHLTCLSVVPIFQGLGEAERLDIARAAASRQYRKGEVIYLAGDRSSTLYVLHEGQVKLSRVNASGREQVLRVLGPGDFFGELSLFSSKPHTETAQALCEVSMCALDGGELKKLLEKQPAMAFKILDALSQRLEQADGLLERVSLQPVGQRVAGALMDLSQGRKAVTLPLSKGDWASQLGMSQETLSRKLAQLAEEGVLALSGQRKIVIRNREALQELSEGGE